MSYAESLGREEKKRYARALKEGGAVTYVGEGGERLKGLSAESAEDYQDIYDEQVAANNAAAASAAEQARLSAETAAAALNGEYAAANKEMYRQYRRALSSLPQELAAMGYTGGASESSRVELERGYEENTAAGERARLAALAGLRREETESQRQGQQAAAEANAEARKEYLGALISLRERNREDERDRAKELAAAGDFSGYEALGYSSEELDRLRAAWEAKNPELVIAMAARSGIYGAGEVAAMPTAWVQQYLNALGYKLKVSGSWNSATENAYKAVFGTPSGRYSASYSYAAEGKEEEEKQSSKRSGSAGTITVRTSR